MTAADEMVRKLETIRRQVDNLLSPSGVIALDANLNRKSVPREGNDRVPGDGFGSAAVNDPTAAAIADPTRAVRVRADTFDDLTTALTALDRVSNRCSREHHRVTDKLPLPVQKELRGCEDCAELMGADGKPLYVEVDHGRYRKWCRDCGDWRGAYKHKAPKGLREHWRKGYTTRTTNTKVIADAYRAENRTPPEIKASV